MTHKIIIVGGGPAGLATALRLAKVAPQLAEQTLLLEAQTYPRPKLCGGGITVHGEDLLDLLGVQPDVQSFHVKKIRFRYGKRHFSVHHPHAMRIVQRAEFDAALADAARQTPVEIQTNTRVTDIRVDDEGVVLTTDRGEFRADVVVAADGAKSTIRRKLKIYGTESVTRLLRIVSPIQMGIASPLWDEQTAVFDFSCVADGVPGYSWEFPCTMDGLPSINRGIFDSRVIEIPNQPHGNLKSVFEKTLQEQGVALADAQLMGHPVRWFNPKAEFSRPRVLLAGDAAGVDPLFAEGISYGMQYAEVVVDVLCDAFAQADFAFADYRERLLAHHLGQMLRRRFRVARLLFDRRLMPLWQFIWRLAAISPYWAQLWVGQYLAVLPPRAEISAELP